MPSISRRKFIAGLGAASAAALAPGPAMPLSRLFSTGGEPALNLLVVGDSLIAGQGLREKDKFYYLTWEWLNNGALGGGRQVELKNKSHSGSNVYLNEEDREFLEKADKPDDEFYHEEVNFAFPSISKQLEIAAAEYEQDGLKPDSVNMIMVSGGITNLSVRDIIDPFKDSDSLRRDIKKYCNGYMSRLLAEANALFPNALIVVIGYYPMISPKSSTGMVYNAILELYNFPGPVKPLMNNILTKQLFKILHAKMTKRSRIWARGSDAELQSVVSGLNRSVGEERAVFVPSPIDESNCFGTRNTLLWKMAKKGRSEDDLYDLRKSECSAAIDRFDGVEVDFKKRFCELSGLGHPNVEGSIAYAESIKNVIAPLLAEKRWPFGTSKKATEKAGTL